MKFPTIRKGVPIPPKRKIIRDGRLKEFLVKLEVGDSFRTRWPGLHTAAKQAGIMLEARREKHGYIGYWRVA